MKFLFKTKRGSTRFSFFPGFNQGNTNTGCYQDFIFSFQILVKEMKECEKVEFSLFYPRACKILFDISTSSKKSVGVSVL